MNQVRVMLRVTGDGTLTEQSTFLSVDKKRKQLTLQEPGAAAAAAAAAASVDPLTDAGRRVGVAAPKMFAFDGLFTQDDSQVQSSKSSSYSFIILFLIITN